MSPTGILADFQSVRPRYEVSQERSLEWLAAAHAEAEAKRANLDDATKARFAEQIARLLRRVGCQPDKISKRGQSFIDVDRSRWDESELYDLQRDPRGRGSAARTRQYMGVVDAYFDAAYAAESSPPDDLIHVTCTGYASPNGAQKLVARRGWGTTTRVTNAYQMGCYASIPALRIASGFLAAAARRADIVHTELCSLHVHAADHSLEQLVVQSLFADGFIRYSLLADPEAAGLRVLALQKHVLPDSAASMSWIVGDHGMEMTLARDIPDRVASAVRGFVAALFAAARRDVRALRDTVVAVHPGGPKIIDHVRKVLGLDEGQVEASRSVLFDYGNMSSATLPHIWMRVLADPSVPGGTLIPSLAFGPGLTICGALLEKR